MARAFGFSSSVVLLMFLSYIWRYFPAKRRKIQNRQKGRRDFSIVWLKNSVKIIREFKIFDQILSKWFTLI